MSYARAEQHRVEDGDGCMTQEQIAKALGVTKSRVYQIERRALAKLRAEMSRLGWTA